MRRPPGPGAARGACPRPPAAPALKGRRIILDLFAGEGGVGRRCKRYGYHVIKYELNDGPEFDLASPAVLAYIEKLVRGNKVYAIMLAPPARASRSRATGRAQSGPALGRGVCPIKTTPIVLGFVRVMRAHAQQYRS